MKPSGSTAPVGRWLAAYARRIHDLSPGSASLHPNRDRFLLAAALAAERLAGPEAVPPELARRLDRRRTLLAPLADLLDAPAASDAWSAEGPFLLARLYGVWRKLGARDAVPPGLHITPPEIGRPLVRAALHTWWRRDPDRSPTILDPACGPGTFLLWCLEEARERERWNGKSGRIILRGTDVDPLAVDTCRFLLWVDGRTTGSAAEADLELRSGSIFASDPVAAVGRDFDVILGNPPWVSLKGRFRAAGLPETEVRALVRRYGASSYRPNLAELFIWRGLELLRPGGVLAFVVPDRIAANLQFENLRRFITGRMRIRELTFGLSMPGVVASVMTLVVEKRDPSPRHRLRILFRDRETRPFQKRLAARRWHAWMVEPDAAAFPWLRESIPLCELARTSVGFIGRRGTVTDRRVHSRQTRVVRGRDVAPYVRRGCGYFRFQRENLAGGTQDVRKLGAAPKILVRKTGHRLIAAYDASGDYPEQSLYFLYAPRCEVRWLVLLAWLNSDLLHGYVKRALLTNPDSMAQLKKVHLDRIPVPAALVGASVPPRETRELERLVRVRMAGRGDQKVREDAIERMMLRRIGAHESS